MKHYAIAITALFVAATGIAFSDPAAAPTAAPTPAPAVAPIAAPTAPAGNQPQLPPLTPKQKTQMENEEKEGDAAAADIAKSVKFVKDPAVVNRIATIGARIAAVADTTEVPAGFGTSVVYPFKYSYQVIDSKDVNAFSIPGGHIYIYKGLLDLLSTDDEIAGVLGHETAHAAHHHISELTHQAGKMDTQMLLAMLAAIIAHVPAEGLGDMAVASQYVSGAILNNHFSEHAEEDADHTGMIYMMKAGYNPVGMLGLMMSLKRDEDRSPDIPLGYLQDHPLTSQRIVSAHEELTALGIPPEKQNYDQVDGMIATVVDQGPAGSPTESDVLIAKNVAFRVAGADQAAAEIAASKLNECIEDNLQLYEVRADGPNLIAKDHTIIQFTDKDGSVQSAAPGRPPATPEQMAADAAHAIRTMLWSKTVTATTEQEIDVGTVMP